MARSALQPLPQPLCCPRAPQSEGHCGCHPQKPGATDPARRGPAVSCPPSFSFYLQRDKSTAIPGSSEPARPGGRSFLPKHKPCQVPPCGAQPLLLSPGTLVPAPAHRLGPAKVAPGCLSPSPLLGVLRSLQLKPSGPQAPARNRRRCRPESASANLPRSVPSRKEPALVPPPPCRTTGRGLLSLQRLLFPLPRQLWRGRGAGQHLHQ